MAVRATFPTGPATWLILLVFGSGLAVAFIPASRALPGLSAFWWLGLALFRNEFAVQAVMAAGCAAHVLEACYTLHLCRQHRASAGVTAWWAALTLALGYSAIGPLRAQLGLGGGGAGGSSASGKRAGGRGSGGARGRA